MCYIQLTAHSWQQAWFSTLHCEPGFSLHPLVSQHGSNSWQFFRKKWKEKGNFMWIKTFSQSEAGEGGCRFLQKIGIHFSYKLFFRNRHWWELSWEPASNEIFLFCQKWSLLWNWLIIISYLQSESHLHNYSLTSSLPQSHSSPCSTSPFPHLGLISCRR